MRCPYCGVNYTDGERQCPICGKRAPLNAPKKKKTIDFGILHYCVANIPGAVPYTSTLALTNATLPYALQLADKGWRRACAENEELRLGLNIVEGKVVYRSVAEAWGLPYEPLQS